MKGWVGENARLTRPGASLWTRWLDFLFRFPITRKIE